MGNCFPKQNKSSAEIAPSDFTKGSPVVTLYGSPYSTLTSFIRIALMYKSVSLDFITVERQMGSVINRHFGLENTDFESENPVLRFGSDIVTGSSETLLRYIEAKFPEPPLLDPVGSAGNQVIPGIVLAVTIQHKSMTWYLESLVKWAEDLATRGKGRAVDPSMGSPVMEVRKFGRSYSQLLEVMLEHAQMEERILFPVFERADRGLSKAANEDHARDLPIMNGIKEDIKSIGVLDAGSPVYQEGMFNISSRLKTLQEHCKEHFEEEERELLPLLEATELSEEQQDRMLEQCFEVMEGTHSLLIHFLILGLRPRDAIQYLSLITRCSTNTERTGSMLRSVITQIGSTISSSKRRPTSQAHHHLAMYRGTTIPSNEDSQIG